MIRPEIRRQFDGRSITILATPKTSGVKIPSGAHRELIRTVGIAIGFTEPVHGMARPHAARFRKFENDALIALAAAARDAIDATGRPEQDVEGRTAVAFTLEGVEHSLGPGPAARWTQFENNTLSVGAICLRSAVEVARGIPNQFLRVRKTPIVLA